MSRNQRQYVRLPFSTPPSSAELVVGRKSIKCRMSEISLGGFALIIPRPLPADTEPLVRVKVRDLEYIARIARQEERDEGVLLALQQVEEVLPDPTLLPVTPLGKWLTRAAWALAFSIVVAAFYFLSGTAPDMLISLLP